MKRLTNLYWKARGEWAMMKHSPTYRHQTLYRWSPILYKTYYWFRNRIRIDRDGITIHRNRSDSGDWWTNYRIGRPLKVIPKCYHEYDCCGCTSSGPVTRYLFGLISVRDSGINC